MHGMACPNCEWAELFELSNLVYLKIYKNNSDRIVNDWQRGASWLFFQELTGRVLALNSSCSSKHRFDYNKTKMKIT